MIRTGPDTPATKAQKTERVIDHLVKSSQISIRDVGIEVETKGTGMERNLVFPQEDGLSHADGHPTSSNTEKNNTFIKDVCRMGVEGALSCGSTSPYTHLHLFMVKHGSYTICDLKT